MNFGYKKIYMNGELTDSVEKERKKVICPGTGQAVAEVAWAGKEDALSALKSAEAGFKTWSAMTINQRLDWMMQLRAAIIEKEEQLREAVMYEMGKTYDQAYEDFEAIVNALEWYPQEMKHRRDEIIPDTEGTHMHKIVSYPAGVAVGYIAWNFPLLNLAFKMGPALAAGCSLIIKPSGNSPLSAYMIGEIAHSIQFPAGVINIVAGTNSEVAHTLSSSKIPKVITMIGSSKSGRLAMEQAVTSIKRFSMELGGNAPAIVFDDTDLEQVVAEMAAVKFGNAGQICVSPNRIFVHQKVYDRFVRLFVQQVKNLKVGFGRNIAVDMGPIVDEKSRKRIIELAEDTINEGAKLECGGKIHEDKGEGFFYEQTVFSGVTLDMRIFQEEIFGPLAGIIRFESEEEVIGMANQTESGLSSYLYTRDVDRINRISGKLEAGEVHVNGFKYSIYLPHGGVKESGVGHDCSHLALDDYLVKKRVTITLK